MKELLAGLQIGPESRSIGTVRPRRLALSRRKGLLIASLASIPAFLWFWHLTRRPIVVEVFTVPARSAAGGTAPTLTAGGYARAGKVVFVAPRVSGRLSTVAVQEGDEVRAGDLIAVIDSRDLEQEAVEARANHEFAEATLRRLRAGSRPEEIAEAKAKVQVVARASERAERDLARSRELFDAGIISAQTFDQAKTEYLVGEGNLDAARQSLALVVAGPRAEELEAAKAALAAAHARWTSANNRLGYARVLAPIAGRVLRKFRNVGDYVSPDVPHLEGSETVAVGSPVVSLADLGPQEVSVDVNETDIPKVSLHQAVQVSQNAYPEEMLPGSVTQISPRADRNKNTVEVKVTLEDPSKQLPYDASVKLSFIGRPTTPALPQGFRIPSQAAVERDGRRVVFVAAGSRAALRVVETGAGENGMVEVVKGLTEGDRVIVSSPASLKEGTPIRVK